MTPEIVNPTRYHIRAEPCPVGSHRTEINYGADRAEPTLTRDAGGSRSPGRRPKAASLRLDPAGQLIPSRRGASEVKQKKKERKLAGLRHFLS